MTAIFFVAALVACGILAALLPGCVGAPTSVEDLASMSQSEFDSWRDRVAADAEAAAYAQVHANTSSERDVRNLAIALRALDGSTSQGGVAALVKDEAYAGLVRVAVLELGAWIDKSIGDSAAFARAVDLMRAAGDALDAGADRALKPPTPPSPEAAS